MAKRRDNDRPGFWEAGGAGFSSKTDDWATPETFYAALDAEFSFELDVCASATNHKCARYFTAADDGLAQEWRGTCYMNPPYGRTIGDWMQKAYESAQAGATVVCLVPARTCTVWWHEWAMRADEIRLVRGRLKFGAAKAGATFPSAVVVFRPGCNTPRFSAMERPKAGETGRDAATR